MATITRAQLINRVLENIGIKAAEQTALAADTDFVGEIVDSAHARLKKEGLAPFLTSAIPEWAQVPLRDYVSYEAAGAYGVTGERLQYLAVASQRAERQMAKQTSVGELPVPVKPYYL